MATDLIIPYRASGSATATDVWLQAEQANVPGDGRLGWRQLQQMLRYARAGMSALTAMIDDCRVEVEGNLVRIPLQVNVYPSSMTLPYSLEPAYGSVWPEVRAITVQREFDLVFDMQSEAAAGELLIDSSSLDYAWATPCFDAGLRQLDAPEIRWQHGRFVVDQPIFGIARVKCLSLGWQHDVVMEFNRVPGQKFSGITNTVQVSWRDAAGEYHTTAVDMKVPPCVEQLLSYCGRASKGLNFGPKDPTVTQVHKWYSECTGEVLKTLVTPPEREPVVANG